MARGGRQGRTRQRHSGGDVQAHRRQEAPLHTPVYVLTHEVRESWHRPGGTTFHFVNHGLERALARARDAAGDRDVRIAGGGDTIRHYLEAGLIDEFSIALAPVFFGSGVSPFNGIDADGLTAEQAHVEPSSPVTHLTYALARS